MTLVSSGELGMRSINAELGRTSTSQISLDTAENGGYGAINAASRARPSSANPAAISEWYGYDHNAFSGPTTFPLPEIGYDLSSFDRACQNAAFGIHVAVWGDGPALQDCNTLYGNATGTTYARRGFYAEGFTQFGGFMLNTTFTEEGYCRL